MSPRRSDHPGDGTVADRGNERSGALDRGDVCHHNLDAPTAGRRGGLALRLLASPDNDDSLALCGES
ncbi:hypothetical protein J6U32_16905 [Gordonia polyisoprenivorans]|nr:hypothetical protein [Gordonia polyisoprenivorans]QTI71935.1 hypothetical protein J6U32_16905 [Gordonia polyisoprenivorans]